MRSICRTARGHDGHVARCGLAIVPAARAAAAAAAAAGHSHTGKASKRVYRARERRQQQPGDRLWSQLRATRQSDDPLIIPVDETWWVDGSMDVGGLVIYGKLRWDTNRDGLELRANYVLVEGQGEFHIGTQADPMNNTALVHIKNSSATHPHLGRRFIGGYRGLSEAFVGLSHAEFQAVAVASDATVEPTISMWGKPLHRTWSKLVRTAEVGATQIFMEHDPEAMGWSVGDEIAITTTTTTYTDSVNEGLQTTIAAIGPAVNEPGTTVITLADPIAYQTLGGITVAGERFDKTAEVMNLARSIRLTGDTDDFSTVGRTGTVATSTLFLDN